MFHKKCIAGPPQQNKTKPPWKRGAGKSKAWRIGDAVLTRKSFPGDKTSNTPSYLNAKAIVRSSPRRRWYLLDTCPSSHFQSSLPKGCIKRKKQSFPRASQAYSCFFGNCKLHRRPLGPLGGVIQRGLRVDPGSLAKRYYKTPTALTTRRKEIKKVCTFWQSPITLESLH
jgi:hypothetical protein